MSDPVDINLFRKAQLYNVTSAAKALDMSRNTVTRYIKIASECLKSYADAEEIQRRLFPTGYQVIGSYQLWVIAKISILFDVYQDVRLVKNFLISNAELYNAKSYKAEQNTGKTPENINVEFLNVIAS